MTLCCAWYSMDGWQLASDSRISVSRDLTVDISVKVTSFHVRIPFPSSKGQSGEAFLVDQDIGFMAAGDVATTLPTRESLRAVMSWLWVNPTLVTELSMRQIAEISSEILLKLWRQRSELDSDRVLATVALVGYCPKLKKGRAFLLAPRITGESTEIVVTELDPQQGPQYFGSGAQAARELSTQDATLTPPEVIRRVIQERLDRGVGGRVQYGKLVDRDFRVFAVYDFDLHEEDKTLTTGYYIGGVELLAEPERIPMPEGYSLLPNLVVTPFMREQEEWIRRGYNPVTNYSHFPVLVGRRNP